MKYLLIIVLLILLISCSSPRNLFSSEQVNATFNKKEIKDMGTILDFFEQNICKDFNNDYKSCYKAFNKRMLEEANNGRFGLNIPYNSQKEMYKKLNDTLFNEIWSYGYSWKPRLKDSIKIININFIGKYVHFLEKLGNSNTSINKYYEDLQSSGDISPLMINRLIYEYDKYEIENIEVRLFFAIHYLTLNDQFQIQLE